MATKGRRGTKRKPARRKGGGASGGIQELSRAIFRAEVGGVVLVLLAIFTVLSLLTPSRGEITDGWVGVLRGLFGMGVWGFPVALGVLGLWLVIRAVDRMPDLAWQRPIGILLVYLAGITGLSLLLRPEVRAVVTAEGDAGGMVGTFLAGALEDTVGGWGAWAFVTFVIISGLALLLDRILVDGWYAFTDWQQRVQERRPRATLPVEPPVPVPSGRIPWWKRLWPQRSTESTPFSPPAGANLVLADPPPARNEPAAERQRPAASAAAPAQAAPAHPAPQRPLSQPISDPDVLTPRIVGGAQEWRLPAISAILSDWDRITDDDNLIRTQGRLIQETLALFGVPADFEGAYKGPSVTQYLIKPGYVERKVGNEVQRVKVKVAKIAALSNDLALALAASSVRIEAPIPGTNYVGVEVPNQASNVVGLKELMESEPFLDMKGRLRIALGEDVKGQPIIADLSKMPHLLIAGATGSGKSVCINSIIACLLLTHTPETLRLLMIDPKMVELSIYNGVPHLLSPVVTELDKAAGVLYWAVKEMERRYTLFNKANARDITRYNTYLEKNGEKPLPYIVVVVDEMADLMMAAPEEVEKHICRLAQMARAVGIHLIIATQRPSVDVITGLIKANFPARIAFAVTSQVDSRVILDIPGAERLLGRGDMLFMAPDASKLERLQGSLVTDEEINRLVRYWKGIRSLDGDPGSGQSGASSLGPSRGNPVSNWAETTSPLNLGTPDPPEAAPPPERPAKSTPLSQPPLFEQIEQMKAEEARDELFYEAVNIVRETGRGSVNLLQRKLRIGYSRAARLVDQLEEAGILGPDLGGGRGRDYLGDEGDDPGSTTMHIIGDEEEDDGENPQVWF
ncbi:MAG: DNA translocase FtsK 4TM domain-containing protein [Caldilineaceae bacterium]|nr:DNA translocase FtsK 4TM domain-containing protein [Caldilineaceae bacterium]